MQCLSRYLKQPSQKPLVPIKNFIYVVVNFFIADNFYFPLFQLHWHTLPYPKTKEKQKLPETKN